jgi:hypothetical protein
MLFSTNTELSILSSYQWRTEGGGGSTPPPPKFRSFDNVEPECKLSGKCLVFLIQHHN